VNGSDIQFDSLAIADLHLDCHVVGGKFFVGGVGGG